MSFFRLLGLVVVLLFVLGTVMTLASCTPSSKYDKKLLTHLEQKYQQPFSIVSKSYNWKLKEHNYTLSTSTYPGLDVYAVVKDHNGFIYDTYPHTLLSAQAKEYFSRVFKEEKGWNFLYLFKVSARYDDYDDSTDYTKMPTFDELLKKEPKELDLSFKLTFFTEPTTEVLEKIAELDHDLRPLKLAKSRFLVYFYPKEMREAPRPEGKGDDYYLGSEFMFDAGDQGKFLGKINYVVDPKQAVSPTALELEELLSNDYSLLPEVR